MKTTTTAKYSRRIRGKSLSFLMIRGVSLGDGEAVDRPGPRCHRQAVLYRLARPALFAFDAERAHGLAIKGLRILPRRPAASGGPLETRVAGLLFPNPVGMAAGFDKDGEVPDALLGQGFGFVEVGSITPRPQAGSPRPRLFRLAEDRAVINRMRFNNRG